MDYKAICPVGSKLLPDLTTCAVRAGAVCLRAGCVTVPQWLRDQVRYLRIHRTLSRANLLLTASRTLQRTLQAAGIETRHLPQPVSPPSAAYVRAPTDHPTFLFAGRLSREKGVEVLLEAFRRLRDAHPAAELRIAGDGPLRADLEAAAVAGWGSRVRFLGPCPPERVEAEMAVAWAVVQPSVWEEPFGLVALEAIVRGVPVIVSECGGLAENVEPQVHGLLVPPRDTPALVRALDLVSTRTAFPDHALASPVVEEARHRWGAAHHARALLDLFGEVIAHARQPL
jgi:glycosyltransferase involved in cell wall biosynthesis